MNKLDKRLSQILTEDKFRYLDSDAKAVLFYVYIVGEEGVLHNAGSLEYRLAIHFEKTIKVLVDAQYINYSASDTITII